MSEMKKMSENTQPNARLQYEHWKRQPRVAKEPTHEQWAQAFDASEQERDEARGERDLWIERATMAENYKRECAHQQGRADKNAEQTALWQAKYEEVSKAVAGHLITIVSASEALGFGEPIKIARDGVSYHVSQDAAYDLAGALEDLTNSNGNDAVTRNTIQRVIDRLHKARGILNPKAPMILSVKIEPEKNQAPSS